MIPSLISLQQLGFFLFSVYHSVPFSVANPVISGNLVKAPRRFNLREADSLFLPLTRPVGIRNIS
jgi:hypothetical protein